MPFTLSHAAAALPLRHVMRGASVFPALVIGCFIPDIPYFLPDPFCEINAHQLPGLILFGIPSGWAIYALWRFVLLQPSIALLPRRYALLLFTSEAKREAAASWWSTSLSFLAGAVSHVVWDSFTHRRGLVAHAWPVLAQPILHLGGHALPPYLLFQHGSTALGLAWLAFHVRRTLRVTPPDTSFVALPQFSAKAKVAIIAALTFATMCLVWRTFSAANAPALSAYNLVCRSISTGAAVALAYAIAWHAFHRHRSEKSGRC